MKKLQLFLSALVLCVIITGCERDQPNTTVTASASAPPVIDSETPIRLGWQPPWANQGQIVEVMKHDDVIPQNNVKIEYVPFSYGGPMTEAALAGRIDVLFAGDQPVLTLMSKNPSWKIVARMVNYRSAIVVPMGSPLHTLADLKGKTIATAFGSTTHRDAVRILRDAGLETNRDVKLVSVDQAEHAALIGRGGDTKWGQIDAVATYDPTVAVVVGDGKARILKDWISPSVVAASDEMIRNHPDKLERFLKAYIESYSVYAASPSQYDDFYVSESHLDLRPSIYGSMAKSEPNMTAKSSSKVNVVMSREQIAALQKNADTAVQMGILKVPVVVSNQVDQQQATSAQSELHLP